MSKKKNKKEKSKKSEIRDLILVKPEESKKENFMEKMSRFLFEDFFRKKICLNESIINDDMEIVAFIESEDKPDDIICYTISPASNPDVSVYVDKQKIDVELNKTQVTLSDEALGFLVMNIVNYVEAYMKNIA